MSLYFSGTTNHDYCMINMAYFITKDERRIGVDRMETDYSIKNGKITMEWRGLYAWEVGGKGKVIPLKEIKNLLMDATLEYLELEDDSDADYEVTIEGWGI